MFGVKLTSTFGQHGNYASSTRHSMARDTYLCAKQQVISTSRTLRQTPPTAHKKRRPYPSVDVYGMKPMPGAG